MMFKEYVPMSAAGVVLIVKVDVLAFASVMLTGCGLKEAVVPAGFPLTLNVTGPVKPPVGAMLIV
jgi:hypothetical protein